MEIGAFQRCIHDTYGARDTERGLARTFAWFTEECGELSRALFRGGREEAVHEFADVLAWLTSLADQAGIDLEDAAGRYADSQPGGTPPGPPGGLPSLRGEPL